MMLNSAEVDVEEGDVGVIGDGVGGVWESLVEGGKTRGSCCHFLLLFSVFCFGGIYDKKWE